MRQGKATYLFPGSNTPAGFLSFYREGLKGTEHVFILKGGPGCGKSTLMRKIGLHMLERGYDVEFWQCSSDNDSLDGVRIPALSVAIVDGTAPHTLDPLYPGAVEEIVNLGEHWQSAALRRQQEEIISLSQRISERYAFCYGKLREAGALLETEQAENSDHADTSILEQTLHDLADHIFSTDQPRGRHLFASAVTPRGLIRFTEPLSRRMRRRFILTGPVGGGKEQLIAALAHLAEEKGHRADIYHHTLLPETIELLLLPELEIAVVAAERPPQETLPGDTVIVCGKAHDEAAAAALQEQVETLVAAAANYIAEARALHDSLEAIYRKAVDFPAVESTGNRLFSRILALAADTDSSAE